MNLRNEYFFKGLTKRSRTYSKRALTAEAKIAEMNQNMTDLKLNLEINVAIETKLSNRTNK